MGRRIVATSLEAGSGQEVDGYQDRLLKYIPSDINAAWLALTGIIKSVPTIPQTTVLWVLFIALLILTPMWVWRDTSSPNKPPAVTQIVISTGAFFVWVFALGGPFTSWSLYQPVYGSIVLIFYTLLVSFVIPQDKKKKKRK